MSTADALRRALADELIAFFYYVVFSYIADGLGYPEVADEVMKVALDELDHAREIAALMSRLSACPTSRGRML